eukprot:2782125-Amphidinium_carterae.1
MGTGVDAKGKVVPFAGTRSKTFGNDDSGSMLIVKNALDASQRQHRSSSFRLTFLLAVPLSPSCD